MIYWGRAKVPEVKHHAYALDPVRLKASAVLAYEDFKKGCHISKYFPIEVLLYYYGTHQVKEALRLNEAELEGVEEAYFADIDLPPLVTWFTVIDGCVFKNVDPDWWAAAMEVRLLKRRKVCGKKAQK